MNTEAPSQAPAIETKAETPSVEAPQEKSLGKFQVLKANVSNAREKISNSLKGIKGENPAVNLTPEESEFGVRVNELDKLTTDTEAALAPPPETPSPEVANVPKHTPEPQALQPQGPTEVEMVDIIDSNASDPDAAVAALVKVSLKDRVLSPFKKDNKSLAETASENLDQKTPDKVQLSGDMLENQPSQDSPEKPIGEPEQIIDELLEPLDSQAEYQKNIIDPDKEYSDLVRELQEKHSDNQYEVLKEKVFKARQAKDSSAGEKRVFNDEDHARHQRLLELASKKRFGVQGGLKLPDKFVQMVEYIEANSWYTNSEYEDFDHDPTTEELAGLKEKWGSQGYKLHTPYEYPSGSGRYTVGAVKIAPSNFSEDTVEVLREIANTAKDPAASLEFLSKLGIFDISEIGRYKKYVSRETKDMIKFLSTPGADNLLQVVGGIGNFKKFYSSYSGKDAIYTALSRYTKSGLSRITPEEIEKIDIISAAKGYTEVNFENLAQMKALAEDRESFDFVVASCLARAPLSWDLEEFFNGISTLKQDGLLVPLTELYKSNVSVLGTRALQRRVDAFEGSEYKTLQDFVRSDEVREFLGNQDMKDFAGVAKELTGITPSIAELNVCFNNKEKIAALLKSTTTEQDKVKLAESSHSAQYMLGNANVFIKKGNFDVFSSPDFQEYVSGLHEKYGIDFTVDNYLYTSQPNRYKEEGKYIPIELFKLRDVIEVYGKGDIPELVEKSLSSDDKNQSEAASILTWYEERNKYIDTIKIFQKYKGVLGEEKVAALLNANPWELQGLQNGGLCTENIFQQIPQDQLADWVDASTQVPGYIQSIIGRKISERGVVVEDDIQKIKDIRDVLYGANYTNNLFRNIRSAGILLAESDRPVSDYFQDSLPTDRFLQESLDGKLEDLLVMLTNRSSNFSFSEDYMNILSNWRGFPTQIRAAILESDSDLSQVLSRVPEKYQVLSRIYKYGNVTEFNPATIAELSNLGDSVVSLLQDGVLSRQMVDILIKSGDFKILPSFLKEDVLVQFDEKAQASLRLWKEMPFQLRGDVINREPSFPVIPPDNIEKYEAIVQLLEFTKHAALQPSILDADTNILKIIPERCAWMGEPENTQIFQYVFENALIFLQNEGELDFINKVVQIAAQDSLAIFKEYRDYIKRNPDGPKGFEDIVDYAYKFNNPQTAKDVSLRRGYKMFGDYLTLDSYISIKGIINGSVSDEVLSGMGITLKGEEGLAQLETKMQGFILGLAKGNSDLSLLEHKIFSDFLKSYIRYDVSAWGNHSSDNFSRVVQTLQRIRESNPELLDSDMPSSGIQEIAKIERAKTNESTFTDSFISRYSTFTDNIQQALDAVNQPRSFSGIARNIKAKIDEQVLELEGDLEKNIDKPQARLHIQKRIDRLKTVNPGEVKSFQANFSALAQEKVFNDLLMQAVFAYTLQKFPEQRERMAQVLTKETPDVDSISAILDFTEHMTTKEAWKTYFTDKNAKRAFQNILDTKEINDGLSRLTEDRSNSRSVTPVEFVPTRGILMEFSGYIADACWASRYDNSAEQFPNITTIVMQDVSKEVPKLLGSCLLIETTSNGGGPLLIIRGLNPLESYINHVDIPDFYGKFTDYVKRLAELKERKAAIVIDDHSGGASTNRPLLFNFLSNQKNNLSRIDVPSENTTFNGYNISNSTYLLPT